MAWRVHLTNQAIQRLDILKGKPSLLAVWTRRDRVHCFNLNTGAEVGEQTINGGKSDERKSAAWQVFLKGLTAPNNAPLPQVRVGGLTILTTDDGLMRLYASDGTLSVEIEGKEIPLETGGKGVIAVGLDRFLGLVAALDEDGKLHIFQQHIPVGVFDMELDLETGVMPAVVLARGGAAIFVTDGRKIIRTDSGAKSRKVFEAHYFIGRMACSPDGSLLAASDTDNGVIRLYNGKDLTPTHQRHAIDLLAEATQVQLIADLPPENIALSALAVSDKGLLAFAMSGVVCVTEGDQMDALPRPQALL